MRSVIAVCSVCWGMVLNESCSKPESSSLLSLGSAGATLWPPLAEQDPPPEMSNPSNPWLGSLGGVQQTPDDPTRSAWQNQGQSGAPQVEGDPPPPPLPPEATHGSQPSPDAPVSPMPSSNPNEGPNLLLRRYREGLGNDKLLTVEYLSHADSVRCVLQIYSNGNSQPWRSVELPTSTEPGSLKTLCTTDAPEWPCDAPLTGSPYNGNDALVVECDGVGVVDSLGQVGFDPGDAWASDSDPAVTTQDTDLLRCGDTADLDPSDPFVLDQEWVRFEAGEPPDELCLARESGWGGSPLR